MLYEISNLVCSYDSGKKKVLHVKELAIPRKKIIVILGLSGIGKSTLLETLGLMNNTIISSPDTVFKFYGNETPQNYDFSDIWKKHSEGFLSDLRNQHFSFIFQDTNLMPNFSAIENIMLTLMLQGHSKKSSRILGQEYLERAGLGEIEPNRKVHELSGGQRQRIAFIRAICPEFTVLLGDEPTGNLDRFTSRTLMQMLQSSIREKEGSAIIVSHDIDLSVEFADQIVIINKREAELEGKREAYGLIFHDSIYNLQQEQGQRTWLNGKGSYHDLQMISLIKEKLDDQSVPNRI